MAVPLNKQSKQLLVDLINQANYTAFRVQDLNFSLPTIVDEPPVGHPNVNASVIATGTGTTRFTGPKPLYYKRLDLTELLAARNVEFIFDNDGADVTMAMLLAALNARHNLAMDLTDIEDGNWSQSPTEDVIVPLLARPSSLTYIGEAQLVIKANTDAATEDLSIIVEDPEPESGQVPTAFESAPGVLLVGEGNPSTDLYLVDNGEIQIGGAIRLYNDTAALPHTAGAYDIELEDTQDWNFIICLGLLDTRNDTRISDLYDAGVRLIHHGNLRSIDFRLEWNTATNQYDLVNDEFNLRITDGVTAGSGRVYQEIQRVRFYAEELEIETLNTAGAPLGLFDLQFYANRRQGGVGPLALTLTGNVEAANPSIGGAGGGEGEGDQVPPGEDQGGGESPNNEL